MLERLIIATARALPRGGFRLVRLAARRLESLQSYPVELALLPGRTVPADLRESIWYPLWRHGCYPHQLPEDRLALEILRPGETVWDVGANIGYTALIYAEGVGGTGTVVAFEPSRKSFAYLERTVAHLPNVRCFNLAASNETGELPFLEAEFLDLSGVPADGAGSYSVPSAPLDELAARESLSPPDFIKIDVEGHEAQVIEGCARTIASRLPMIQFEALDPEKRERNTRMLLEASDGAYRIFRLTRDGKLTGAGTDPQPACTNDYLAFVDRDRARFERVLDC